MTYQNTVDNQPSHILHGKLPGRGVFLATRSDCFKTHQNVVILVERQQRVIIDQRFEGESKVCRREQEEQDGYDRHGPVDSPSKFPSFVVEEEPSKTMG